MREPVGQKKNCRVGNFKFQLNKCQVTEQKSLSSRRRYSRVVVVVICGTVVRNLLASQAGKEQYTIVIPQAKQAHTEPIQSDTKTTRINFLVKSAAFEQQSRDTPRAAVAQRQSVGVHIRQLLDAKRAAELSCVLISFCASEKIRVSTLLLR